MGVITNSGSPREAAPGIQRRKERVWTEPGEAGGLHDALAVQQDAGESRRGSWGLEVSAGTLPRGPQAGPSEHQHEHRGARTRVWWTPGHGRSPYRRSCTLPEDGPEGES